MQKKDIVDLIRYHADKDDAGFKEKAFEIARYFDKIGDRALADYIMGLLSDNNVFAPQSISNNFNFIKEDESNDGESLLLSDAIANDVKGLIRAFSKNIGINKILFEGKPGTGKTRTARWLAKITDRRLYSIEIREIIDSKMGQTAKNLAMVFDEIKHVPHPEKLLFLIDEIDALALDRINENDLREMGRVTSSLLRELDGLSDNVLLIATTNLYASLDKALQRRFDATINFNRYSTEDLAEILCETYKNYAIKAEMDSYDRRLLKKIALTSERMPMPGEITNIVKTALAFCDESDPNDSLRLIYSKLNSEKPTSELLEEKGFTLRESALLLKISKTQVARILAKDANE